MQEGVPMLSIIDQGVHTQGMLPCTHMASWPDGACRIRKNPQSGHDTVLVAMNKD